MAMISKNNNRIPVDDEQPEGRIVGSTPYFKEICDILSTDDTKYVTVSKGVSVGVSLPTITGQGYIDIQPPHSLVGQVLHVDGSSMSAAQWIVLTESQGRVDSAAE